MVTLTSSTTFSLNPDVLTLEKENKILITFASLEEKIFQIDGLAKEVFSMAVQSIPYETLLDVCRQTSVQQEELEKKIQDLLGDLVARKILIVNEA